MSIPDTAKYWNDVNQYRYDIPFVHAKGILCGHNHGRESDVFRFVTCPACLKILNTDTQLRKVFDKNECEVEKCRLKRTRQRENKRARKQGLIRCKCGAWMVKRINRSNNKMFWGCSNYPKCKHTQTI